MERALSDFLEREEARPFEAYRFYSRLARRPSGGAGTRAIRSPLSRPAGEPFVIGHFQIDPTAA